MILSQINYTIHMNLTAFGDALFYGYSSRDWPINGLQLKQRLFAWHAPSFYGTALEIQQLGSLEAVPLPAEQVLPFLAECPLLLHMDWSWSEEASLVRELAQPLMASVEARGFAPSFEAFKRTGKAQFRWTQASIDAEAAALLAEAREELVAGLAAAYSAAVFDRYYGTETLDADLRREHPLLFAGRAGGPAIAGMDEQSWLVAIGWTADTAPFRPLLQLLEPDELREDWRLQLALQDKSHAAQLVPVRLSRTGSAVGAWPDAWSDAVRSRSSSWAERLRALLPAVCTLGRDDDVLGGALDNDAAWRFLHADSQRLLEAGWQVLLPAWWEAASRKKPRLRAKVSERSGKGGSSLFGLESIIDFDWRVAIGNLELTEEEFAELAARNERLVRFRGQWVTLDPALLSKIRQAMAAMDSSQGLSFQDVLQLHLLETTEADASEDSADDENRFRMEVELNSHLKQLIRQLGQPDSLPKPEQPPGLLAELRGYQLEGYGWLTFLRRLGLGACLADDMGLGKTVQLISYLLNLKQSVKEAPAASSGRAARTSAAPDGDEAAVCRSGVSLIICPTSVLGNWQKELQRFAPELSVTLHYGGKRLAGEEFHRALEHTDVLLTSYATAALDQELLQKTSWASLCLDEAQNIKNAQTKQSAAVRSLHASHRIALTGTPIENRLSELWSIYDFINPGYLGTASGFSARFAGPIEKEGNPERTSELQRLVKPFLLRRKKKDPAIQLDLPDKNEMKTYLHLTAEQGSLYNQTVNGLLERMQKLEGIERKGAILGALTQLKQLCDHPGLFMKEPLPEQLGSAGDEGASLSEALIQRSSKLERLVAMVKELREEGERCLIFTQYVGMGEMLQQVLAHELREPVLYLNGSTSKTARDRMIAQFQASDLPPEQQPATFILSIKAGGVGLNLTAANHVFHFDRWWNPAVENQATDRAYRMGQTRDVQVHKFIALGTLEERIDEMLESKQQLSDNVITSSEGWITELSTDELKELFTLRQTL